jgi:hypothetical protein
MSKNLEILNELKMNAPSLLLLKEEVFHTERTESIEKGYFDKLQEVVLSQYAVEKFTMGEEQIPRDYFSKMQSQVLNKVSERKQFRYIHLLKYASVMIFITLTVLSINNFFLSSNVVNSGSEGIVQMIDDFSDDELLMVLDDYATNKYNFNLLMDKGIVDITSNDIEDEDTKILNYLNLNEYELYEAY